MLVADTAVELDEYRDRIFAVVDAMVLEVGRLLLEAKLAHPGRFGEWVDAELPFGRDRARRLIAIHVAYGHLPASKLRLLPRPWQALFALRHLAATGELDERVAAGEIGPSTTVAEAVGIARRHVAPRHSEADLVAGRLLGLARADLSEVVADALGAWLRPGGESP